MSTTGTFSITSIDFKKPKKEKGKKNKTKILKKERNLAFISVTSHVFALYDFFDNLPSLFLCPVSPLSVKV